MKAVGLITEYNPFHNGHLHHLAQSKKLAGADIAVAVMSGHFLQRGEAALTDKWRRARMALAAGVDLVIELPLPWACSSAPDFARGGVLALSGLGGIDAVCFGSEAGELEPLQRGARQLLAAESEIGKMTAQLLRQGVNYPSARARALADLGGHPAPLAGLAAPNNILGIEYLKALSQVSSPIRPLTIPRLGAGYHDLDCFDGIASATGIRKRIAAGEDIAALVPKACRECLDEALKKGEVFSPRACCTLLQALIFREGQALTRYWLVEGGIENRLVEAADSARSLEDLVQGIKSRQLTRTRVQRLLVSILLGFDSRRVADLLAAGPRYLHLLAASRRGEEFLAVSRCRRELPLVQNFSRIYALLKRHYGVGSDAYGQALYQLQLEQAATRIYSMLLETVPSGHRNQDFFRPVIRPQG